MTEPIKIDFIGATPGPKGRFNTNWRFRPAGVHGEPELYCSPGHTALVTPKYAEVRGKGGLYSKGNYCYALVGNSFYRIDTAMAATLVDTIDSNTGPVSSDSSETQIMIIDDKTDGYIYTYGTNAIAKVTDEDWPDPINTTYVYNFFVLPKKNSNELWISELKDGTSVDGSDFRQLQARDDINMGCSRLGEDLWVFGEESTEPLEYTGGAFPFTTQRVTLDVGLVATHSLARGDGSLFWLNQHREVCKSVGLNYVVVAHEEITKKIGSFSKVDDAIGYFKYQGGHGYYILAFPSENVTFCHDVSIDISQSWTHWSSGTTIQTDGRRGNRHRSNCYTHFIKANKHLIGDFSNGKISELSLDVYDDDGEHILVERIPPGIEAGGREIRFDSLEIFGKRGVGDNTITDPKLILDYSDDLEGQVWKNEREKSMGKIGQPKWKAIWPSLGTSDQRTFRLRSSEKVERTLTGAALKAKMLRF